MKNKWDFSSGIHIKFDTWVFVWIFEQENLGTLFCGNFHIKVVKFDAFIRQNAFVIIPPEGDAQKRKY